MSSEIITILMFGCLLLLLILGLPLSYTMGGIGIIFAYFLWGTNSLMMIVYRAYEWATSIVIMAVPLFIAMGIFLEKSGVADSLYETIHRWSGSLRGGLAIGTVVICTLFAAMTGVAAAATISMGLIALPSMLSRKYDKSIALGSILSGGTLGILIPPSVIMILLSLISEQSVGKLFAGGIIPGLIISFLFIAYIGMRAFLQPRLCPPIEAKYTWAQKITSLVALFPPIVLVLSVLGSIFAGLATPTEAASIGAFGAFLCVIGYRKFSWQLLRRACTETLRITGILMWIVIAAQAFISAYSAVGGGNFVKGLILGLEADPWFIITGMLMILFVMGMFLDTAGIIMLVAPIFFPIVNTLGFDSLWFAILFVIMMCIGYISPPFGWSLFYLKGIAPPGVTLGDIMKSVWPFVGLMFLGIILFCIFPQTVTWLPSMIGK